VIVWNYCSPKIEQTKKLDEEIQKENVKLFNVKTSLENDCKILEMEKSSLNREKETLNKDIEFSYEKAKAIVKDNEILLKEKKERAYEEATEWYKDVVNDYKNEYLNTMEEMSQKASATISEKAQTIKTLEHNLLRLQSIVQAATKANQRAQQELEKKNYYRIQITDLDVQEIKKIRENIIRK